MVNEWTRDDLPTLSAIAPIAADPESYVYFAVSIAFDAVVKHLNTHYPKPENPVVDQVEAKAQEIAQAIGWGWDVLDDEYVEIMRSVAAHVLGQGDRHVDQ